MWNVSSDERIDRLEHELFRTRQAIIRLLPPTVQEIADDYYHIATREDAAQWLERMVEKIIGIAWPYAEENAYSGPRAYCPLCKSGTQNYMANQGFLLPGGLRKHLLGEGNAYECDVLAAVRKLAESYWRPRVEKQEEAQRAAEEARKEERRRVEEQYLVGPSEPPLLRDEQLYFGNARDDESLQWAVDRLCQLGFTEKRDGLIRQFTKECDRVTVFADPRARGRINFSVYRRAQLEKPRTRRRWRPHHSAFHLLDSWRNDLLKKFEQRVASAEASLF